MEERQVIVTGSRDWPFPEQIYEALTNGCFNVVIQGGARGADRFAYFWAKKNNMKSITINADWDKYGKRAGFIRNEVMLRKFPKAWVYAFCLNGSKGTVNCYMKAKELGMNVRIFHCES